MWLAACDEAVAAAKQLANLGVHKQYVNRILEPFAHISVVVSATEYSNFFTLRYHSMAQPEIQELAKQMWEAYQRSTPELLTPGQWHLPFVTKEELKNHTGVLQTYGGYSTVVAWDNLIKMSVARCARVSYNNHDGTNSTYEQDCALYDRLLGSQPIHASPAEHQAKALYVDQSTEWSGNFRGWLQYRKTLEGENITEFKGP
jgi:thymidylate synthase ThyX